MPWTRGVWRGTEREEWASETSGLYGSEYEQKAEILRAVGQGTRNDIADALRGLTTTVLEAGHRTFDVDVLADMIEQGLLAPMMEPCEMQSAHEPHQWRAGELADEPVIYRACPGVRSV